MHRPSQIGFCLVLGLAGTVLAQTPTDATAAASTTDAPTMKALPSVSSHGIDFSGFVDVYYSLAFNHPASKFNVIRNFDVRTDRPSLNMAMFTMQHAPAPIGFRIDIGGGRALKLFHATEPSAARDAWEHIFQAYVSLKPTPMKGFQVDFGKFVTSAGAEVTETHLNWNYSRALLYANGPYYHTGFRTVMPVHKNFTAGVQVVNGWNNIKDNNDAKTVGLTGALTTSKVNWFNNYYVGSEKPETVGGVKMSTAGLRHFWDTVVAVNPNSTVNFLFNFDYGVEKFPGASSAKFYGYSTAMRVMPNSRFAFSPRFDWYKDRDGFITGKAQTLKSLTVTGDWKFIEGILGRLEYRGDHSNLPFFDRGNEPGSSKNQHTLLAGLILYFSPKK